MPEPTSPQIRTFSRSYRKSTALRKPKLRSSASSQSLRMPSIHLQFFFFYGPHINGPACKSDLKIYYLMDDDLKVAIKARSVSNCKNTMIHASHYLVEIFSSLEFSSGPLREIFPEKSPPGSDGTKTTKSSASFPSIVA